MKPLPKGPRGSVRVTLAAARDPIGSAERWRRQYGDPMTYPEQEGKPLLVIGSPAAIRGIFSAPPETFEPLFVDRLAAVLGETSLLTLSGAQHAAMRKLLMPPFHGPRMRLYGTQIRDITLEQTQGYAPGTRFVAQELMHAISLQAIIRLVFGVSGAERVARAESLIAAYRQALPRAVLPMVVPWLRRNFWGLGPWARLQRALADLRELLTQQIARGRAEPAERTDILSLLLSARHEDGTALSDAQLFDQLLTLLFAGHSTTATALTWALYRLSQEPQALSRLQAELASLGKDPEPEVLAKAPYLEAVCHEILRLYPAAPVAGRKLVTPLEVAGCDLPAGGGVLINILWAHYHPEIYPQPEQFLPERFLERTHSPFEFLPFGGGNRRCIGAAFALYEMKIVLGTLLQRFSFERATKKPIRAVQLTGLEPSAKVEMIVRPATP